MEIAVLSKLNPGTKQAIKDAVSVWDSLLDSMPKPRPEGSKTAEEFALDDGCSLETARRALEKDKRLRSVIYKTPEGRRGKCYVVAEC